MSRPRIRRLFSAGVGVIAPKFLYRSKLSFLLRMVASSLRPRLSVSVTVSFRHPSERQWNRVAGGLGLPFPCPTLTAALSKQTHPAFAGRRRRRPFLRCSKLSERAATTMSQSVAECAARQSIRRVRLLPLIAERIRFGFLAVKFRFSQNRRPRSIRRRCRRWD